MFVVDDDVIVVVVITGAVGGYVPIMFVVNDVVCTFHSHIQSLNCTVCILRFISVSQR